MNDPQSAPVTVQQALNLAIEHHQTGRLAEAEAIYRQVLARQPNHPEALHLLGVIEHQMGRPQAAADLIGRAIAVNPESAAYHNNMGMVLAALKQKEAAIEFYRTAIRLQPDFAGAYYNLGNILMDIDRTDLAADAFRTVIRLKPDDAEAFNRLGVTLINLDRLDEGIEACRDALRIRPDYPEAYNNLGSALNSQGRHEAAVIELNKAVKLRPDYAAAYYNLGNAFRALGQIDEGIASYQTALRLMYDYPEAHNNLAHAFKDQGQLEAAISEYREAVRFDPKIAALHSNLILTLYMNSNSQIIREELSRWNARHATLLKQFISPHVNNRDRKRRLKIGYVSADFYEHVSAFFLEPLLSHHNHEQFEIFCYSQVKRPDAFTHRCQSYADQWRNTVEMTDEQLAAEIRRDQIDILVDLKLHTKDNRLLVFARKPAPVQVTWMGYPGSTGLDTIDYRLTDPYLDPPGLDDEFYSEQSIYLPDSYWCYSSRAKEPSVNELPALKNGYIMFGCLNSFTKINENVLKLWSRVLNDLSNARLILLVPKGGQARQRVTHLLESLGVTSACVEFVGIQPRADYLNSYNRIDIALDPFPYNGGVTTCDSLWMGVPVVSLSGNTAVGRSGKSILTNIGLPELIAQSPQEYVDVAVKLANDLPRLKELRGTLRQRMENSPLMDAKRFARNMEAAYREMWQKWCAEK